MTQVLTPFWLTVNLNLQFFFWVKLKAERFYANIIFHVLTTLRGPELGEITVLRTGGIFRCALHQIFSHFPSFLSQSWRPSGLLELLLRPFWTPLAKECRGSPQEACWRCPWGSTCPNGPITCNKLMAFAEGLGLRPRFVQCFFCVWLFCQKKNILPGDFRLFMSNLNCEQELFFGVISWAVTLEYEIKVHKTIFLRAGIFFFSHTYFSGFFSTICGTTPFFSTKKRFSCFQILGTSCHGEPLRQKNVPSLQ